ncbi:MAG TPA: hypothetical protein VJK04_01085 [Candidatus Paceibacterota bacterium]
MSRVPRAKEIYGKTYLPFTEAAKLIGVSHVTLHRWVKDKKYRDRAKKVLGEGLDVMMDTQSGARFLNQKQAERLRDRFVVVK